MILFALLLLAAGGGVGFGIGSAFRPEFPSVAAKPANLPAEAEERFELLKSRIESADDHEKNLDRLATLLLTLTSLYALVLGLNSYFGLKQILDSGRAELQEFRTKLQEHYPEMASLHDNVRMILAETHLMFPAARDWTTRYSGLGHNEREKIRLSETRLAGLEIFQLSAIEPFRNQLRGAYQGLGRFYSSKYKQDERREDWERACVYFDRAVQADPVNLSAELLKDQGVHLTLIEQVLDREIAGGQHPAPSELLDVRHLRERAALAFRGSLSANANEAGAHFGLGWLSYKNCDYRAAILEYSALAAIRDWPAGDREKYLEDALLNEAGCHSLLRDYDTALSRLEQSLAAAEEYGRAERWKEKLKKELNGPDLQMLSDARKPEIDRLLI